MDKLRNKNIKTILVKPGSIFKIWDDEYVNQTKKNTLEDKFLKQKLIK